MHKTVTYLYPMQNEASNLKIFQDKTSQIQAFYFTKENIDEIKKVDNALNYAIYFLFDNSELDESRVYIGKSTKGIERINEHRTKKEFWSYCIMFVTDNNTFDTSGIDYLEYKFIEKLNKSSYIIENSKIEREPNLSIYDKPVMENYVNQIEFLLNAEGIIIDEVINEKDERKYYKSRSSNNNAKIFVKDGKFVLVSGSEVRRPPERTKEWKDKNHYKRFNKMIDKYIDNGKVKLTSDKLITTVNLTFSNPSVIADLVSGVSENGWKYFKGLEALRE